MGPNNPLIKKSYKKINPSCGPFKNVIFCLLKLFQGYLYCFFFISKIEQTLHSPSYESQEPVY